MPPAAALITACPGDSPLTTPAEVTVATACALDDHVTAPVLIAPPFWSSPAAEAVVVCPAWMLAGDTETAIVVSTSVGTVGVVGVELPPPPPPLQPAKSTQAMPMPRTSFVIVEG